MDDKAYTEATHAVARGEAGKKRRALDQLYQLVDTYFREEDMAGCDAFLADINVDSMDTQVMVGLLTVTAAARDRLPSREGLVKRIRSRLMEMAPDRAERLLAAEATCRTDSEEGSDVAPMTYQAAVAVLLDAAKGTRDHLYEGLCPEPISLEHRDPNCLVCQAIHVVESGGNT